MIHKIYIRLFSLPVLHTNHQIFSNKKKSSHPFISLENNFFYVAGNFQIKYKINIDTVEILYKIMNEIITFTLDKWKFLLYISLFYYFICHSKIDK